MAYGGPEEMHTGNACNRSRRMYEKGSQSRGCQPPPVATALDQTLPCSQACTCACLSQACTCCDPSPMPAHVAYEVACARAHVGVAMLQQAAPAVRAHLSVRHSRAQPLVYTSKHASKHVQHTYPAHPHPRTIIHIHMYTHRN